MIYKIVTRKNLNGRGNRNQSINTYFFKSEVSLDSADAATAVSSIIFAEKLIALDILHFMDARMIREMNNDGTLADGEYRYFQQAGTGQRESVGGVLDPNLCLVATRAVASKQAGRVEYRGSLKPSDVVRSPDGSLTLAPAAAGNVMGVAGTYSSYMANMSSYGNFVIPRPESQRNLAARVISGFTLTGTKFRQVSVNRTSLETARAALIQRELNALSAKARRLQRQVANGLVALAQAIGILQSFWDTGMGLINALPVLLRGALQLGRFFGAARPTMGA